MEMRPPNWQSVFVDGQCIIEGTLAGTLTIGSSGDMWLIDDIEYRGADLHTGRFGDGSPDEGGMVSELALVSEANIIIQDNSNNGKANGFGRLPDNFGYHSIALDGVRIAQFHVGELRRGLFRPGTG